MILGFLLVTRHVGDRLLHTEDSRKGKVEGGGVVIIGLFPVAFGTTETIAKVMAAVGIALAVLFALPFLLRAF